MKIAVNTITGGMGKRRQKITDPCYDERYISCLIGTANKVQQDTRFIILTTEDNAHLFSDLEHIVIPKPRGAMSVMRGGIPSLEPAIQQCDADLMLSPIEGALKSTSLHQVLYALDLSPWLDKKDILENPPPLTKSIRKACMSALGFIVPSEYYRRASLEHFQAPLNKISVVPPGVNPVLDHAQPVDMFENPFIMLCTDANTADSLEYFLNIWENMKEELNCNLVIFGPGSTADPHEWGADAIRIEHFPDSQLAGLYNASRLFIYPALNEGTGIRVIEGLRAGAMTISPENKSIHEFVGSTPVFYNPANKKSLEQCMRRVLDYSVQDRAKHIDISRKRVKEFDWEKSAWKLLQTLKKL